MMPIWPPRFCGWKPWSVARLVGSRPLTRAFCQRRSTWSATCFVAEGVDAIRLVVAHLLGRRVGQVEAAQAGDDAGQLGPPVGHPRVPAQRRAGRDQRHEIAGLQLALQELGERHLGAVAFGLGQVDVVEEQHEGPAGAASAAGVGAVGVAARGDRAGGRRRRRVDGTVWNSETACARPSSRTSKSAAVRFGHRLAGLVDDHGVDDDEVGAGPEGRLIGGRRLLRHDGGRQHRRAGQPEGGAAGRSAARDLLIGPAYCTMVNVVRVSSCEAPCRAMARSS